jgi:hypothetical protein
MIAGLIKLIVLFIVVYLAVKLIRFFILLMKAVSANVNNQSKNNNSTINEKKKSGSDVIELNKDQYRVD